MKNKIIWSCLLFFFCSSLLIYLTASLEGHKEIDTTEYQTVANAFIMHKRFFDPRQSDGMPLHPIGYAIVLGVAGVMRTNPLPIIIFIQILASLITIYLLFLTACELFDRTVGYITAIVAACNIGLLTYAQILLTESMLLLFLTIFLYLFARYLKTFDPLFLSIAAIALSISVLIKPNALFFPLLIICFLAYVHRAKPMHALKQAWIFSASYAMPLLTYTLYNYIAFKKFTLTGTMHENMYYYFIPRHVMHLLDQSEQKNIQHLIDNGSMMRNGLPLILDLCFTHPLIVIKAWFSNVLRTVLGLYATQLKVLFNPLIRGGTCSYFKMEGQGIAKFLNYIFFGSSSLLLSITALFESIWIPIQLTLISIASYMMYHQKKNVELLFILFYIAYFILITGHDGCSRYRLPAEPMLIIAAAFGIHCIYQLICKKKNQGVEWQTTNQQHNSGGMHG